MHVDANVHGKYKAALPIPFVDDGELLVCASSQTPLEIFPEFLNDIPGLWILTRILKEKLNKALERGKKNLDTQFSL